MTAEAFRKLVNNFPCRGCKHFVSICDEVSCSKPDAYINFAAIYLETTRECPHREGPPSVQD